MIRIISSRKLRQLKRDAAAFRRAKEGYQMNTAAALGGSYAPAIGPCVVTGIDQPIAVLEDEALEWNLTIRPLTLEERMDSRPFLPHGRREAGK